MVDTTALTVIGGSIAAGLAGAGALAAAVFKRRPDNTTAEAAFQTALNGATAAYTAATEKMIERQEKQLANQASIIADLTRRLEDSERRGAVMREAMDALKRHSDDCDAEAVQMRQRMESLEALLRRAGFNIPAKGAVTELTVTTLSEPGKADITSFDGTARRKVD